MILKSFVLGNRLSLCMKILNSVVVVGLYYGLLITLSIGPSYLFLLRALVVMEKGDKGIDLSDMPIPANDDAISSIRFILNKLVFAILEGRSSYITNP